MALDTRPPRQSPVGQVATPRERDEARGLPSRSLLVALVLACVALMVVDRTSGEESPVAPVRRVVGEVLGPAQAGASSVLEPILGIPDALRTNAALRADLDDAERAIDDYEERGAPRRTTTTGSARSGGSVRWPPAPATCWLRRASWATDRRSPSRARSRSTPGPTGVGADMTVVSADGLVGRVIEVTSHTATVLLIVDAGSTVGGRVGDNLENGFVEGRGGLGSGEPLNLDLIDHTVVPEMGQTVVTWGSEGAGPYVAGVPIGEVSKVYEDLRAGTYRAVLEPYVDFTSLADVGVVVPRVTTPG